MSALAITGLGVVAATGVGREAFAEAMLGVGVAAGAAGVLAEAPDPAPDSELGFAVPSFDIREHLGRRGTSFLDRCTGLALVACAEAIEDSGLQSAPGRIGVSLGTSTGSLRSMSDYTRETLIEERPYLVNPALFPTTVMNCAAGQSAIRFGLHGVNSTIAGGALAFLSVLHVCSRSLRLGQVDAVLAGAVEELSPHRAAQCALVRDRSRPAAGEGAVVVALEPASRAERSGRHVDARLEAVTLGFAPGGERGGLLPGVLRSRIERALGQAGVDPADVQTVGCAVPTDSVHPSLGEQAVAAVLDPTVPDWIDLDGVIGDCGAASAALHAAAILLRHRQAPERDGGAALLVAWTSEGAVAAAVLRGQSRPEAVR